MAKIAIKFWFTIYAYCISLIDIWVKNQSFSKMDHDLYLMTTLGFWEFEKPWCVHFWRGWWWFTKNIQSFYFVSTKLEWRLKCHCPLEGNTFISAPRELSSHVRAIFCLVLTVPWFNFLSALINLSIVSILFSLGLKPSLQCKLMWLKIVKSRTEWKTN